MAWKDLSLHIINFLLSLEYMIMKKQHLSFFSVSGGASLSLQLQPWSNVIEKTKLVTEKHLYVSRYITSIYIQQRCDQNSTLMHMPMPTFSTRVRTHLLPAYGDSRYRVLSNWQMGKGSTNRLIKKQSLNTRIM